MFIVVQRSTWGRVMQSQLSCSSSSKSHRRHRVLHRIVQARAAEQPPCRLHPGAAAILAPSAGVELAE